MKRRSWLGSCGGLLAAVVIATWWGMPTRDRAAVAEKAAPTTQDVSFEPGPFGLVDDKMLVSNDGSTGYLLCNGHLYFLTGARASEILPTPAIDPKKVKWDDEKK